MADWINIKDQTPDKEVVQFCAKLPTRNVEKTGLWREYKGYVTQWKY